MGGPGWAWAGAGADGRGRARAGLVWQGWAGPVGGRTGAALCEVRLDCLGCLPPRSPPLSRAPDPGHSSLPETGPGDADPQVRPHASPLVRGLLIVAGSLCVALGLVGMFLPLLPTTPFLLLAAACYARASRRFYEALLASRTFGPVILEWRRHRSVPYRTKLSAIALMSLTLGISIVFFVPLLWAQVLLALFGLGMAIWMYRLPSRDRPRP